MRLRPLALLLLYQCIHGLTVAYLANALQPVAQIPRL